MKNITNHVMATHIRQFPNSIGKAGKLTIGKKEVAIPFIDLQDIMLGGFLCVMLNNKKLWRFLEILNRFY